MATLLMRPLGAMRCTFHTRAELALENLALRQQLANLRHTSGRPRIRMADLALWLVLSRLWSRWADVLVIVKPDTVIRWHRTGFSLFWRWKSRSRTSAQNDVSPEVKALIRRMAEANVGGTSHPPRRRRQRRSALRVRIFRNPGLQAHIPAHACSVGTTPGSISRPTPVFTLVAAWAPRPNQTD
jgi:hypothetical protein